jgi:hypothetical protein
MQAQIDALKPERSADAAPILDLPNPVPALRMQ